VDVLQTLDDLGRVQTTQQREGPGSGNFDSVESDYDSLGRGSRVTVPYLAGANGLNGSGPSTTQTYDALSRPLTTTDGGGGTLTLSYPGNDVLRVVNAPSGENPKQRQSEYDSVGDLKSVCEITSASGSGTCAQTTSATGYWTKYTYDGAGRLLTVTQNAQSSSTQSRSDAYDELGRMTSETNPETGSITYVYDSDSTCGTSDGDLVKKVDAAGNVTCYAYDALHRVTSITYPSGPNSSNTPSKHFIYDGATVDSVAMANAKAHLAEAYTCSSSCTTKLTDEGFSYTVRGEVATVYESTPHSSGYFWVTQSYWANGTPDLETSNLGNMPAITYGVDGEGRVNTVSAGAGQNPVTGTTYNVASEPTQVNLGSGDNDAFQFDANTFRMTQYQFNINGQSDTGKLTWNVNATLGKLAITDAFNSSDTQTCTYGYDDLARIASANCAPVWSQTFTYDAFGNITKTGSEQFQPGYNYQTNQMSTGATYDSMGDVVTDSLHSYVWDSAGRPTAIDSMTVTYDAFGRMVEQNNSGSYTQIVWSPAHAKFGYMNGQTFVQANVPLPARMVAAYNSNGLLNYHHVDWLGSYRLASTPSRTVYWDGAYAPFGEPYGQSGSQVDLSFAGNNEDTTTNLYDAQSREYEVYGRWPSPDPAGIAAVSAANPQSWNRYAYVLNDPLRRVDPSGLFCVWDDGSYDSASNHSDTGTAGSVYSDVLDEYFVEPSDGPDSSTPTGCEDAGGTWFDGSPSDYGLTSDWSAQPNSSLAGFVNDWTDNQGGGYNLGYNGLVTTSDYTYFQQNGTTPNQPFLPALLQAGQIASPQNIFELWGSSVVAGACGGVGWQACTAVVAVGTYTFNEIFGESGGVGPPTIHVPSEGPTGQEGPESAPISGPPVSGPPVP
jgi:RHS repeat-associated protein